MNIEWHFEAVSLPLEHPFSITRGTTRQADVGIVELDADGYTGTGACAPAEYLGDSMEAVDSAIPELGAIVADLGSIHQLDRLEKLLQEAAPASPAARAAVSTAMHDLVAQSLELPLYRYWGLEPDQMPETTVTIGLQPLEAVQSSAARYADAGFDRLKIKLDRDQPIETVAAVREVASDVDLFVDANGAWDEEDAVATLGRLAEYDIVLAEQPVPAGDIEALAGVTERVPVPIVADEACESAADIPALADACDGVVLKLMKCGGLREAWQFIHTAHAHDCQVLAGCMVESSALIASGLSPRSGRRVRRS
ncbi:MAG: dipeptide epimerase [Natrialbaceae archaeon]|nr:dipeptide epimerase [Natrialbaceae archaeon]